MDKPTTDLNAPTAPDGMPAVLRYAAEKMLEQNAELQSAWQQGKTPWVMIAQELERCAARIEKRLP